MATRTAWTKVLATEVRVGDHVRHRDEEFDVARIDAPFMGRDDLLCLIEDTPQRWHAHPAFVGDEIERRLDRASDTSET